MSLELAEAPFNASEVSFIIPRNKRNCQSGFGDINYMVYSIILWRSVNVAFAQNLIKSVSNDVLDKKTCSKAMKL